MNNLKELYNEYLDIVKADIQGAEQSACDMADYIAASTARYHGRCVKSLYVPKLFTPAQIEIFNSLIDTLYGIFNKVIEHYCNDSAYREKFGFDERLEALILEEPLYSVNIPIARIDIFLDEDSGDFKFCEFNTDGTSAMNEDRELCSAVSGTSSFKKFAAKHRVETFELFDSWVYKTGRIYADYCRRAGVSCAQTAPEDTHVCIVDFMENATENEFAVFAGAFRKAGYTAEICDIRELSYRDKKLYAPSGKAIDIIYRRAVTSDIMEHFDAVKDFIAAVKDRSVCLIGDFRTQIVHNKTIFEMLHDDMTGSFLSGSEKEFIKNHVPYTAPLNASTLELTHNGSKIGESIYKNRRGWIIKPKDSYGSRGVHAGVECSDEEWRRFVSDNMDSDYILQEFIHPYATDNIDFAGDGQWHRYSNLTGLFVYCGRFAGIYSRISSCEMISTQYSEMALPTFLVSS